MPRLVAFLRGINVGGRIVRKEVLIRTFEDLGFLEVSTFRQSGNVLFEAREPDADASRARIEPALKKALGYEVACMVRSVRDLKRIVESEPFRGVPEAGSSFLVTLLPTPLPRFAIDLPASIPKSTAQVLSASGAEVYSVTHGGGEGALPNPFVESKLKVRTTTRNMNVVKEIADRYGS